MINFITINVMKFSLVKLLSTPVLSVASYKYGKAAFFTSPVFVCFLMCKFVKSDVACHTRMYLIVQFFFFPGWSTVRMSNLSSGWKTTRRYGESLKKDKAAALFDSVFANQPKASTSLAKPLDFNS